MDKILAEGWKRLDRYLYRCIFPITNWNNLCDDIQEVINSLDKQKFHEFRFRYNNNNYLITFHFITPKYVFVDLYNLDEMSRDIEFVFRDNTFTSDTEDDENYKIMKYGIKKIMRRKYLE